MAGSLWARAAALADLQETGRKLVRLEGRAIALFQGGEGVFACANQCPHEGYPLIEGNFDNGCVLTCNWHNWKFDLASGETLMGGDRLKRYPTRVENGEIFVDLAETPAKQRRAAALSGLQGAFEKHEYDRMARELARYAAAGGDPRDAVTAAAIWTHDRLEDGSDHAVAVAPDWIALAEQAPDPASALVPYLETVAYLNWDSLRAYRFPFPEAVLPWNREAFLAAIEAEEEAAATARLRGFLDAGGGLDTLWPVLGRAALAHYQGFGHAAIYVVKTRQLIDLLGTDSAKPLLLALLRSLLRSNREDLIPEFRAYGPALARWDGKGGARPEPAAFHRLSVPAALDLAVSASGDPVALYHSLLDAAAWQLLTFDESVMTRTDAPVSQNNNWLSLTHGITFANAVRHLAEEDPELWPAGLLQIACFLGRNASIAGDRVALADWAVGDPQAFFEARALELYDHGESEFIFLAHRVKVLMAVADELRRWPDAPWREILLAATNRYLSRPIKHKHALRTARQALDFVARES